MALTDREYKELSVREFTRAAEKYEGDHAGMPGDARCEFFFLPTYLMTQCLISAVLRAPGLMRRDEIRDTLERGLNGCTLRGLCGHGYEADEVCIDNLKAFLKAGYADLIMRYPQISPAFRKVFMEALESFREDYLAGRHFYGWDQDLKVDQEQLLEMAPQWLLGGYAPEPGQRLYVAYGSNIVPQDSPGRSGSRPTVQHHQHAEWRRTSRIQSNCRQSSRSKHIRRHRSRLHRRLQWVRRIQHRYAPRPWSCSFQFQAFISSASFSFLSST